MTLATTLGLILLLSHPQPVATFLFQSQSDPPVQTPQEPISIPEETKPPQQDKPEPPAQQPPSSTGSTDNPSSTPPAPEAKPVPEITLPQPVVTPEKAPPKASTAKKSARKRPRSKGSKVVVRNGGTADSAVQISSSNSDQQAPQQLKNTTSLLGATTENLHKISGKQLNPNQQDMIKQIHNYMQQSKTATAAGDVQGANNLAVKAHLLSQELVKP